MRFHRLWLSTTFAAMGLACVMTASLAQDDLPIKEGAAKTKEDADPNDSQPEQKPSKPGKPSQLKKLTNELFKDVDDDPAGAATAKKESKLDRVAKGMRNAGEKLEENHTGTQTRKIQEQVIRDLDELIKQLQNPPPPQGNSGGGGGNSGGGGSSSNGGGASASKSGQAKLGQAGRGQPGKAQANSGANASKGGQDKKVAGGSQERTESERKGAEEAARKKKLEMDVWGHLPPHLRDQLLNTYGEKTLPKYQNLVKQFYEALSDQNETPPRR